MTAIYKVIIQDNVPTSAALAEEHRHGEAGTDAQGNILWLALEAKSELEAKIEAAAILKQIAKHLE